MVKKRNICICLVILLFSVCLLNTTITAHASDKTIFSIEQGFIRDRYPFDSDYFIPKTNRITITYGSNGLSGAYTYYLNQQSNGINYIIGRNSAFANQTITKSYDVKPNQAYCIRVTTDDKYADSVSIKVVDSGN